MDPISAIHALASVVSYLLEVAKTMKENKTECEKLCEHTRHILDIIRNETKGNVPPKLELRLGALLGSMEDITAAVKELSDRSFLKRALWRRTISAMIQSAYTQIEKVMQEFKFVALLDLTKMQHEHEQARQLDSTIANANFEKVLRNDQDIITLMQIHSKQMQEAMLSLHQHLAELPVSSERKVLEHGLHAMQRRSGRMKIIPDEFVITSLDVIIHQDRKLGAGGFAEVFEADWRGTRVAVKILEKGLPASAIQQEVNVWRRLHHPYILEFFGACPIADPPFMVCAYKENGDAVEYLRHFPDIDRRQLLSQSAQGLDYLHRNNVVHGDLKATNILIDSHGNACLSDFGLSRVKTQTATIRMSKEQQTQAGTVRWMAPEHMLTGVANKKTDVYSFAMTMYEIFTLLPPFASTPDAILVTVICDRGGRPPRPDDPEVEQQGFDDTLWELMTKCWGHKPGDRPDASGVANQLAEICTQPLRTATAPAELTATVLDQDRLGPGVTSEVRSILHDLETTGSSGTAPPSVTAPLPTVPGLFALVPSVSQGGYDPVQKIAWCRNVLFLANRTGGLQVTGADPYNVAVGPVRITDPELQRLIDFALALVIGISSPDPMPQPTPAHISEAVYLRATCEASGAFPQFIKRDSRMAFRNFLFAARNGYAAAWFRVGRDYEDLRDVPHARAAFEQGVNVEDESCLYRMGMAHLMGQLNLPPSPETALPLLNRAATLATVEVPQPAYVYGLLLLAEFSHILIPPHLFTPFIPAWSTPKAEARKHLERAAYLNFSPAQYKLGHSYEFAIPPFPFDPLLSVQYYSLAGQQGESKADMALSKWFLCGSEGVFDKDEGLARTFAEKAAREGLPAAEFAMGYYDEVGVGGPKDIDAARKWYTRAADHGNEGAKHRLDTLPLLGEYTWVVEGI